MDSRSERHDGRIESTVTLAAAPQFSTVTNAASPERPQRAADCMLDRCRTTGGRIADAFHHRKMGPRFRSTLRDLFMVSSMCNDRVMGRGNRPARMVAYGRWCLVGDLFVFYWMLSYTYAYARMLLHAYWSP